MFNDFNTDVFLSSKAVKDLKEVSLLATSSSTLNLIYESIDITQLVGLSIAQHSITHTWKVTIQLDT